MLRALEYVHEAIEMTLTAGVHRTLERRPNADVRDLLGSTETVLDGLAVRLFPTQKGRRCQPFFFLYFLGQVRVRARTHRGIPVLFVFERTSRILWRLSRPSRGVRGSRRQKRAVVESLKLCERRR